MNKNLLLTLVWTLAITVSAMGAERMKTEIPRTFTPVRETPKGEITVNGQTYKIGRVGEPEKPVNTRADVSTPVITTAPGELQYYCKDVIGYALGSPIQGYGVASNIKWDGNDAYFLDIVTAAPMGTYVKGTRTGSTLWLPMHQTVLEFEDEDYNLSLGLFRPVFTEDTDGTIYVWFEYCDDYDSVVYSIDEIGTIKTEDMVAKYTPEGHPASYYNFPNYVIGYYYTDDYKWSGYCDVFQAYDEFNYERVVMPEGLPITNMTYINSEGMGVIVKVAETEDALYIKGLSAYAPDAVFKADILSGGQKIAVAPDQFIGIEYDLYYIITSTVKITNGEMELVAGEPVLFNLERDETGKIVSISADDSPLFLVFNDDPFYFWPMDVFMDLNLTTKESFAGTPCTPTDVYYGEYATMMGANYVFFELSSFANNGDIIDINNLYYSVFLNDDPVEFEETDGINLLGQDVVMYNGIKEPTYLVPYTFANDVDLYEDMGGTFIVGLYAEGIDTVGVESVYIWDGVTTTSELVTVNTATGEQTVSPGINKVETIAAEDILSVEYFDFKGNRIYNPGQGLYVRKYNLKDGSSVSRPVIRR